MKMKDQGWPEREKNKKNEITFRSVEKRQRDGLVLRPE